MSWSGLRAYWIVIFGAVTLAALWFGQVLYERYYVHAPLQEALLQVDGVVAVEITQDQVEVKLAQISDLSETFTQIRKVTEASPYQGRIIIKDNPDPRLEATWDKMHLAIYEAASRANFQTMAATVARVAGVGGIDSYAAAVDNDYIYVQLSDGSHYLYRVIPRQTGGQGGSFGD